MTVPPSLALNDFAWPDGSEARSRAASQKRPENGGSNRLLPEDRPFHEWYRFVLSFPPHLVRDRIRRFGLGGDDLVLDPFCGTGTTLVECKRKGIPSLGIEANPMAHFASETKLDWSLDPAALRANCAVVAGEALSKLAADGIADDPLPLFSAQIERDKTVKLRTLPAESWKLVLAECISPLPLHKALVLAEAIIKHGEPRFRAHQRLALARLLAYSISNLTFGPEVGVGPAKVDAPVVSSWLHQIHTVASDLSGGGLFRDVKAKALQGDSRELLPAIEPESVSAVITSPPYPNEKDYTRTTRLELVMLGFVSDREQLRAIKRGLLRSNTRGVYRDDDDHEWVSDQPEVQRLAAEIERRRIELGKTSGFERTYARVTRLYFGGMAKHLAQLRPVLRPGARLAYVVGDQASYLRVMIRTGTILGEIAQALGYEVEALELFRTRLATATKAHLREEILVLTWPGH